MPCEEKVVLLEAEIQVLKNVISDQHRYIQELHKSQAQQLEHIPNSHLGPGNVYRGRARFQMEVRTCLHHNTSYVASVCWLFVFVILRGR